MNKKLKELKKKLDKQFKMGSLILLDDEQIKDIEVVPTDIYSLDKALGVLGIPTGRMLEIFGPESSGKTTLALYVVAAFQKLGGVVAYIDVEHTLDLELSKILGVNVNDLVLAQPNSAEEALELIEQLTRSGDVQLIVVDSVAALVPQVEVESEYSESQMGVAARLMSKACRKLNPLLSKTNTTILWINQIRMKIGIAYGNPEVTTGGNALKFYCSQRLEVRKGQAIKDKDKIIGHNMNVKVVKNKVAPPFIKTQLPLYYGKGIDKIADIRDYAVDAGVIKRSGASYEFKGEKIAHGKEKCAEALANDEKLLNKILEELENGDEKNEAVQTVPKADKEKDKE